MNKNPEKKERSRKFWYGICWASIIVGIILVVVGIYILFYFIKNEQNFIKSSEKLYDNLEMMVFLIKNPDDNMSYDQAKLVTINISMLFILGGALTFIWPGLHFKKFYDKSGKKCEMKCEEY